MNELVKLQQFVERRDENGRHSLGELNKLLKAVDIPLETRGRSSKLRKIYLWLAAIFVVSHKEKETVEKWREFGETIYPLLMEEMMANPQSALVRVFLQIETLRDKTNNQWFPPAIRMQYSLLMGQDQNGNERELFSESGGAIGQLRIKF